MNERLKELAKLAAENENGCSYEWDTPFTERFAELVRQDEREACAKLCDDIDTPDGWSTASLSASIRARGNDESIFNN